MSRKLLLIGLGLLLVGVFIAIGWQSRHAELVEQERAAATRDGGN